LKILSPEEFDKLWDELPTKPEKPALKYKLKTERNKQ
jgi:hypothetical protein